MLTGDLTKAIDSAVSLGRDRPTDDCVRASEKVLEHLTLSKMKPDRVTIDPDGTVGIYFFSGLAPDTVDTLVSLGITKDTTKKTRARFAVGPDGDVVANITTGSWHDVWFVGLSPGALDLACGRIRRTLDLR